MKIYIAGKITGDNNYVTKFLKAKETLKSKGFNVVLPIDIADGGPGEYSHFFSYEQFLHVDYALIDVCDGIYMLKDWQQSKGARMELQYAADYQKEILYEDESTKETNFPIVYGHPKETVIRDF